jgi:predicted Zn-dependent peptidase
VDETIRETAGTGDILREEASEPDDVNLPFIEQKLSVAMPLFFLGFKENDRVFAGREYVKRVVATTILLEMMFGKNSDFYEELYREGLINRSFSGEYNEERNFAMSVVGGESADPLRVSEKIYEAIAKTIDNFDENKFERARKVVYGESISEFNSVERIANHFISWYFIEADIFDKISVFDEITTSYAKERLKTHFKKETSALSVIMPRDH